MDRPIKQLQHKLGMLELIKQKRNLSNIKQQLQQNNRLPRKRLLTTRKMATKKTRIKNGKRGRFSFPIFGEIGTDIQKNLYNENDITLLICKSQICE